MVHPDRHRAYYTSIADQPRIDEPDSGRRRRVAVPKANVLTPPSLRALLHPELREGPVRR